MAKTKYRALSYPDSCKVCDDIDAYIYHWIPGGIVDSIDSLCKIFKKEISNGGYRYKILRIPVDMTIDDFFNYIHSHRWEKLYSMMIIESRSKNRYVKNKLDRLVKNGHIGSKNQVNDKKSLFNNGVWVLTAVVSFSIGLSVLPIFNYIDGKFEGWKISETNSITNDKKEAESDKKETADQLQIESKSKQEQQSAQQEQHQQEQQLQENHNVVTSAPISIDDTYRISFGKKTSPEKTLHVFVDPNCPHCREAEKELAKLVMRGYNVIQYPVAVVSKQSEEDVGTIMCNGDNAAKTMMKIMSGEHVEHKTCSYASSAFENNNKFFFGIGLDRVPAIIHGATGNVKIGVESADAIESWIKSLNK